MILMRNIITKEIKEMDNFENKYNNTRKK